MNFETISLTIDEQVATLTLNRPPANAINLKLAQELMKAAIICHDDPGIRAVIFTANGKMFSAGGDLDGMQSEGDSTSAVLLEITANLHSAVSRFMRMDAPLICAVNGTCAGAGVSLAVMGDITLASENAKFAGAYTAAGLAPDGGSTYLLSRLIGMRKTKELFILNRVLTADEALSWGMINEVLPQDKLMEKALVLARSLAKGPTKAYGAVKKLMVSAGSESLETQMELEGRAITEMSLTKDGKEGISAFLEKRRPVYTGK